MDTCCHFSEVIQLLSRPENNSRVFWICRLKSNISIRSLFPLPSYLFPIPRSPFPVSQTKRLHGEVAVDAGDDDVAGRRTERTVDHEEVSVVDARACHGVPLHANEECRCGTLHQEFVQVERRFLILFGWRRKPRHDRSRYFHFRLHSAIAGNMKIPSVLTDTSNRPTNTGTDLHPSTDFPTSARAASIEFRSELQPFFFLARIISPFLIPPTSHYDHIRPRGSFRVNLPTNSSSILRFMPESLSTVYDLSAIGPALSWTGGRFLAACPASSISACFVTMSCGSSFPKNRFRNQTRRSHFTILY